MAHRADIGNLENASRARHAVERYAELPGTDYEDRKALVTDLMTDLLHYVAVHVDDDTPTALLRRVQMHYDAECAAVIRRRCGGGDVAARPKFCAEQIPSVIGGTPGSRKYRVARTWPNGERELREVWPQTRAAAESVARALNIEERDLVARAMAVRSDGESASEVAGSGEGNG